MGEELLGSIVGGAGGIANGLLSFFGQKSANKANKQMTQMNIDANKEMQQTANDFTLDMWNKSNEYNSPANQRKRLLEAGINPLSQQMSQSQAQSVTGATGSVGSPIAMQNELAGLGQGLQSAAMNSAQLDLLRSQAEKNRSDIGLTKQETKRIELDNEYSSFVLKAKSTADLHRYFAENWENRNRESQAKIIFEELDKGEVNEKVAKAWLKTFDATIQSAENLVLQGEVLKAQEKEQMERAKNYAAQILLGYAGLRNNIECTKITAAATRYSADLQYKAAIESIDRTTAGYIIKLLKAAGLNEDNVKDTLDELKNGSGSDDPSYSIWWILGKYLFNNK